MIRGKQTARHPERSEGSRGNAGNLLGNLTALGMRTGFFAALRMTCDLETHRV